MKPHVLLLAVLVCAGGCNRIPEEPTSPQRPTESAPATPSKATQVPPAPVASPALAMSAVTTAMPAVSATIAATPSATPPASATAAAIGATSVAGCPADPEPFTPGVSSYPIGIKELNASIVAEFVQTPAATARGLMYRRALAEDRGMLFLLPRRVQTFWMHNTCIPLDMIFAERDGTIVGIVENATPLTDTERSAGVASSFVLELAGGYARRHGLQVGHHLAFALDVQKAQPRKE
jgi:uncharacterized protein